MPDTPKGFAVRISRKQGVLLAVLGAVLSYVVLQGDSTKGTNDQTEVADADKPTARRKVTPRPAPNVELRRVTMPVEQMQKQNPFAKLAVPPKPASPKVVAVTVPIAVVSAPTPRPEVLAAEKRAKERREKIQQTIAELQGQKVKMILRTDNKTSAMIGNRLVSEGDLIDGVRVVSILPTGVIVKPASPE